MTLTGASVGGICSIISGAGAGGVGSMITGGTGSGAGTGSEIVVKKPSVQALAPAALIALTRQL